MFTTLSLPVIVGSALFWAATAVVLFTTLAPLTRSAKWWIRGWDFPRIHIAGLAVLTIGLGTLVWGSAVAFACVGLAGCTLYHMVRVFPYTPLARLEIPLAKDVAAQDQITLVASNVLMENTSYERVRDMIIQQQPDVVFLMETDRTWADALADTMDAFDTVISEPSDNHYGLIFATNLPVLSAKVVYLVDDETPALLAKLRGPGGPFQFLGLHPRPPVPGQDTQERDAQIKRAARTADAKDAPVVAMGDFNDVAWSDTAQAFKRYGAFRDPRCGRGILPSFDARSWWMRFPIDQLYLTKGLDLVSFERLDPVGSDHFPMRAVIAVTPPADPEQS